MSSQITMPKAANILPLDINVEGLRRHAFLCFFIPEATLTAQDLRLRAWLLHTVLTASRHYNQARDLVVLQDSADQDRDGGAAFHVLDVCEQIEGCIGATYRACNAILRMAGRREDAATFAGDLSASIAGVRDVRNQFEHAHTQVVSGETGDGPILMAFGDEGLTIRFRGLSVKTSAVHAALVGAYRLIAAMFPHFDCNSAPEVARPIVLSMTMTADLTVVDHASTK